MKLPFRPAFIAAATSALVVLPAVAAGAHPSFNPNRIPVGEAVDAVLIVPHGCSPTGGMPEGDDALATIELALRTGEAVTVAPRPVDGWDTTVEDDVVTWTDAGGATIEVIELPVTVTATGEEGEELYLEAYQECDGGGSFRWIALPDEEGWPAVKLVLTAGEVDTVMPSDMDHSMDHGGVDATEMDGGMATEDATTHTMTEPGVEATALGAPAAAEDGGSGNGAAIAVAVVVLVALLAGGLVAASRRRRAA